MSDQANHIVHDAFGMLPNGLYLMTAAHNGTRSGILVSSVSRCCDEPNLICVSARKGHKIDPLIRDSRSFAVGVVKASDKLVSRRFKTSSTVPTGYLSTEEDDPFDAIPTRTLITGAPVLERCMTWFDCEVLRRIDLESEMELFVGVVVSVLHEGERMDVGSNGVEGQGDEGYRSA